MSLLSCLPFISFLGYPSFPFYCYYFLHSFITFSLLACYKNIITTALLLFVYIHLAWWGPQYSSQNICIFIFYKSFYTIIHNFVWLYADPKAIFDSFEGRNGTRLDGIQCIGNESSILQCIPDGIEKHDDCPPYENAGVSCGNSQLHQDSISMRGGNFSTLQLVTQKLRCVYNIMLHWLEHCVYKIFKAH